MKTTHILLIEPDKAQAEAIAQALASPSRIIHLATSAQSAVSQADQQPPDLVILELALPSHNGIEFLHEFRSYQEWAGIPVVLFTQQHLDQTAAFTVLGNITYLYKPRTSLAQLKQKLEGLLA